jgi:hypothetical protein
MERADKNDACGCAGYVYFILMSQVIVPLLQSSLMLGVLEFVVGHVVAGLLMISYVRTIASEPGYVPIEFYLEQVRTHALFQVHHSKRHS